MSITVSTCEEICKSSTNNSTAKMLYTFSKTARFNNRRYILYSCADAVVISFTRFLPVLIRADQPHQGLAISMISRISMIVFQCRSPNCPPPNTYNIKSTFQCNKTAGFGFGKGREEMEVTGPLLSVKKNKNPGPGAYQLPSTLNTIGYSLNSKPIEVDKEKLRVPGPGTYPATFCINQKGAYFLAKYKNSCVRHFSKLENRGMIPNNKVPGPGAYDTSKINLSPKGRYVISNLNNCLTRKFAISTRKPLAEKNDAPGPGNYKIPSQFGHYVSRRAFQTKSSNEPRQHKASPTKSDNKQNL